MWIASILASALNRYSAVRWAPEPMPAVPNVKLCVRCAATNCWSVVAGLSGLTASVIELIEGNAIGSSYAIAKPGLAIRLWLMATPVAVSRTV